MDDGRWPKSRIAHRSSPIGHRPLHNGSVPIRRWWSSARSRLSRLERREIAWLLTGLGCCILLLIFLKLASEVMAGDTQSMDTRIVRALRKADDASRPIGPVWMEGVLEDLTALGGPTVTWLVILSLT